MRALNAHVQQHLALGAVHIVQPFHNAVYIFAGGGDGGAHNGAGDKVDVGVDLYAGLAFRRLGGGDVEAGHGFRHRGVLGGQHAAERPAKEPTMFCASFALKAE